MHCFHMHKIEHSFSYQVHPWISRIYKPSSPPCGNKITEKQKLASMRLYGITYTQDPLHFITLVENNYSKLRRPKVVARKFS